MCAKLLKAGKGGTARIICILIRTIMTQYTRNIAAYYQISEKKSRIEKKTFKIKKGDVP